MAWVCKYRCEIKDIYGVDWKIEIEEDAWGGAVTDLVGTGDPILFEWNNESDDVFEPIKSSRLNLIVWSETNFSLIDLYSTEDLQFRVKAYQNTVLFWTGFIITGNYSEPYIDVPYPVTIVASCGLEHLKNTLYKYKTTVPDDTYYNGRRFESQMVIDILGKLEYTGFTEYVNLYEEGMVTTVAHSPFDQNKIDVDIFRDMYCDEVLKELFKKYNACIIHKNGGFVIYRPKELAGATVYGRIFTAVSTKTATSFTSVKYINRAAHSSTLRQVPGGALMVQRPAKTINIHQDYGYKESWIDNWQLKSDTFSLAPNIFEDWSTAMGAGALTGPNLLMPDEYDGVMLYGASVPGYSMYQSFGDNLVVTSDTLGFSVDYLFYNYSGAARTGVSLYFQIKHDATNRYLYYIDENTLGWQVAQAYVSIVVDVADGKSGWATFSRSIPTGLPLAGSYTITLYGPYHSATNAINGVWKNIKFHSSSTNISIKKRSHKGPFGGLARFVLGLSKYVTTFTEIISIVENTYTKTNAINGIDKDYYYLLGDVIDVTIDNVLEQFGGSLAAIVKQYRVDTITLTGTGGAALVTCNANDESAIWNTTLTQTAADFVTDYAASFNTVNITLTSSGVNLIFTSQILGVDYTGATTIVNFDPNLSGTVVLTTPAINATAIEYTTDWNTRGGSESKPLLEIIGDEIAAQYARPKQLIQMAIIETGTAVTALNLIGHYEDDLNDVTPGGVNRKFVFNRGEYSVKNRKFDIDFMEVINTNIAFLLTSTGDGTGVTTLTMQVSENMIIRLDGTGKFYTNSAGTTGESDTWAITTGADRTIYIKVPSGVSNLDIPQKDKITRWVAWIGSTNSVSLGGDITGLTALTYLRISAINTLSGSVTNLTSLTYLYCIGSNTLSGNVTGLTSLTYLYVAGSNTLSGNITTLTSLTYLSCIGFNTFTGSITNLTSLTYLYVAGSNTLSGSVAGLTSLTYLRIEGSNTVSGSIEPLVSLTFIQLQGNNTVTGDIKIISANLTYVVLNPCNIDTYTSGGDWSGLAAGTYVAITPSTGYGLSAAEVDLLIIEIESTRVAGRQLFIVLMGANAPRTSASDVAVAAIIADGGIVTNYYDTDFDNGKLLITFDDITESQYTTGFPILVTQGVKGTFYTISGSVGNANKMTWVQLQEMHAAGMDIQCHTRTHPDLRELTEGEIDIELGGVNDDFVANSLPLPEHISYPYGAYSNNVKLWCSAWRLTGRRGGLIPFVSIAKNEDKFILSARTIDNINDALMVTLKTALDNALANKRAIMIYVHGVTTDGDASSISVARLNEIIDYAQSIGLDILTISELYALMT